MSVEERAWGRLEEGVSRCVVLGILRQLMWVTWVLSGLLWSRAALDWP